MILRILHCITGLTIEQLKFFPHLMVHYTGFLNIFFYFFHFLHHNRYSTKKLVIDSNIDGKQKWPKAYIFARNTFGRPNTERISKVTFQDGNADIYWDYDPRNGEESDELVPIISYREPSEDEED